MFAVLWTFTAPTTLVRPDKSGLEQELVGGIKIGCLKTYVVKFPDRSIAPAT